MAKNEPRTDGGVDVVEGQVPDPAAIEPVDTAPYGLVRGWPRTMHHAVLGAREFAHPDEHEREGAGYTFDTAAAAERARTPLEADIVYQRMLARQARAIEDGTRTSGNVLL